MQIDLGPSEYGAHLYKRYHKAIAFARLRLKSNTPRVSILLLAAKRCWPAINNDEAQLLDK